MTRRGADWPDEEWLDETRRIRHAVATLGDHLSLCLPDERGAYGKSTQDHSASYCAQLKARA
ncbi:hypothetical protein [Streptomyces cyaneofuscatus]|uniref:hypothetical protein n=1 Tax=Streptomyces cyaneofuscatus TaxID=66883 RepID=UPI0036611C43